MGKSTWDFPVISSIRKIKYNEFNCQYDIIYKDGAVPFCFTIDEELRNGRDLPL
jgi:hypothetical protein